MQSNNCSFIVLGQSITLFYLIFDHKFIIPLIKAISQQLSLACSLLWMGLYLQANQADWSYYPIIEKQVRH